jgi:hypothetical protein
MLGKTVVRVVLVGMFVGCLMILVGCGGPPEDVAERVIEKAIKHGGGDADVDLAKGKVRIKDEHGESEMSFETEWPKDLPEGVPAFTMATVKGVGRSDREGKKAWTVVLEDIREEAFPGYAEQLENSGWAVQTTMATDEGGMLQATKDSLVIFGLYNKPEAKGTIAVSME